MTIPRRFAMAALLVLALPACRILPTEQAAKQEGVDTFFDDKSFDPDKMVREMWDAKVIPYLTAKAGAFPAVRDLARSNADEAGKTYGFRQKEGNSPWTLVTRIDGKIVAANTTSRAGTIDVDADGDGKADVTVQIGPAMRGTALRDCARLRLVQHLHEPDRFRQVRQGLQPACRQDRALGPAARQPRRPPGDGARRLSARQGRRPAARHPCHRDARARFVSAPAHDVVLRLEGVSKVYSGTVAVKSADFEVRRGAVNVLVGENGAGKSTLMKIIAGVEQPTAGRILLDGEPVVLRSSADAAAKGIGIVFQELNLFPQPLGRREHLRLARDHPRRHRHRSPRAGAAGRGPSRAAARRASIRPPWSRSSGSASSSSSRSPRPSRRTPAS